MSDECKEWVELLQSECIDGVVLQLRITCATVVWIIEDIGAI